MKIVGIKTHKIVSGNENILAVLDRYIPQVFERTIVAVTSKIVAISQGRTVSIQNNDKDELIKQEAQFYLPRDTNPYQVSLTISHNKLVATAGIDESNADNQYVLWPLDPEETANRIREHLGKKFSIKNLGVIITDSRTAPLQWGVTGTTIAYSGIQPIKDYIGTKDLFGREFLFEKLNVVDCLASAVILEMGEGAEQTPLAIITELPQSVVFVSKNPNQEELDSIKISMEEDIYAPLLKGAKWKKGLGK